MRLSVQAYEQWLRKRKLSTIVFTFQNALIGSDFSLTFLTLWLYLGELVKPSNPKVYYSIISASYLVASISFSLILGRLVDRTRKVRLTFLLVNSVVVIGNIIYTFQFSPLCLVIGRFLSGMGGPLRSVISGEIARCYPKEQLSRVFSIMGMAYSCGFIAGPAVNFAMKHLDFRIGIWHITYVNAPGLLLALLFLVANILTLLMVFDLSKEYDLKAEQEIENSTNSSCSKINGITTESGAVFNDYRDYATFAPKPRKNIHHGKDAECTENSVIAKSDDIIPLTSLKDIETLNEASGIDKGSYSSLHHISPDDTSSSESFESFKVSVSHFKTDEKATLLSKRILHKENPSIGEVLKKLLTNVDTCLLLLAAFFENYFVVSFDIWLPLLVIDIMHWTITELNIIIFGTGIWSIMACFLMIFQHFSDTFIYVVAICATLSITFMEGVFMLLSYVNTCLPLNIMTWIIFDFFYCFLVITEEIFLVGCLAKMVPSEIQTFVDSIRLSMYRFGGLVALATSALVFDKIIIVGTIHMSIALLGATLLIIRRKTLKNPTTIITLSQECNQRQNNEVEHVLS